MPATAQLGDLAVDDGHRAPQCVRGARDCNLGDAARSLATRVLPRQPAFTVIADRHRLQRDPHQIEQHLPGALGPHAERTESDQDFIDDRRPLLRDTWIDLG